MIKAIIFDYDGVIADSFPIIHKVYQIICKKLGKQCPEKLADFKKVYGLSSRECYKNLGLTPEEHTKADITYQKEILKQKPDFFEEINHVIEILHQKYKLILISSNAKGDILNKLKSQDLLKYFTDVIAGEQLGPMKKGPALINLMNTLKISKDEIVMIGDRVNDHYDAKEAGLNNIILVEYGWGYDKSKIPEHRQEVIINKPVDILKAIEKLDS